MFTSGGIWRLVHRGKSSVHDALRPERLSKAENGASRHARNFRLRAVRKRVGAALSLTLLATAVITVASTTPASAAAARFSLAISPAVGPAGTRVDLSVTGVSPASGTVEFALVNAAGTSTVLGSADVSKSGAASLRVRLNDEGIIRSVHNFVAAGQPRSSVGGTYFRFPTTPPSTVAVDVSSRGYYEALETTLGLTYSVWAYQYRVMPSAPNRSFSDLRLEPGCQDVDCALGLVRHRRRQPAIRFQGHHPYRNVGFGRRSPGSCAGIGASPTEGLTPRSDGRSRGLVASDE